MPNLRPPFIGEHPHRCVHCKSGWLCTGSKCTIKVKSCWPCSTPAKVKEREDLRIAARDRERNAGVTPNIFAHPLGGEKPMYVGIDYSIGEYADYASLSDVIGGLKSDMIEKLMTTPWSPW